VRIILKAAKPAKAKGARVVVANRQPQITKVFEIVKALPDLQVFANDAEMDRYLQHIQTQSQT
jgi:anti-anti-sigma regulatory factor